MTTAREVFLGLEKCKRGYDWSGDVPFTFWGGKSLFLQIVIDYDIVEPTKGQMRVLQALLDQKHDIRAAFERAVFKHYQEDIYGTVSECGADDDFESLTPKLDRPGDIWKVIGDPSIFIAYIGDDEPDEAIRFRFTYYDVPWDEEHGFGIEIRDWKIASFGGEMA